MVMKFGVNFDMLRAFLNILLRNSEHPSAYIDEEVYFIYDEYDVSVSESCIKRVLKRNRKMVCFGCLISAIIDVFSSKNVLLSVIQPFEQIISKNYVVGV